MFWLWCTRSNDFQNQFTLNSLSCDVWIHVGFSSRDKTSDQWQSTCHVFSRFALMEFQLTRKETRLSIITGVYYLSGFQILSSLLFWWELGTWWHERLVYTWRRQKKISSNTGRMAFKFRTFHMGGVRHTVCYTILRIKPRLIPGKRGTCFSYKAVLICLKNDWASTNVPAQ